MSKTILIVENEAIIAQDLAGKLKRLGYGISGIFADGEAAVARVDHVQPDLVLMDIRVEGPMDGVDAARAIQSRHEVPVIFLTAHSDPATLTRAKLTGPFGYILKPFEERDLATQIELALYKHQTERQLREQREWLRVTLTSIGDAVIATDADGRIAFLNPVAESLTGWDADEAVGRPVAMVFQIVDERTGRPMEEPATRILRDGRAISMANHTALVTRDGRRTPIEDSAAPIFDAAGKGIGAVLVFHDVTAKRRAQEKLQALNENLEQEVAARTKIARIRTKQLQTLTVELIEAEEAERRRIAQLLHDDLQQMLASASLHLQTATGPCCTDPDLTNVAKILEQSIAKARRLSHELSPPVLKHASLVASLQWLATTMQEQFSLEVLLESDTAEMIEQEPLKTFMFRAAQELLFNVVKHADVSAAHVRLSHAQGNLVLAVADRGRGFDVDPFDGESSNKTGLGLRSLRERASYMGGGLAIERLPGQGSRLVMTIPADLAHASEGNRRMADCEPAPRIASAAFPDAGRLRVLFVDDHPMMREGLIKMVANYPTIEVAGEASDGQEAIEQAGYLKPDVVVMDVSMPKMNGIEATYRIKQQFPMMRVIGLSMFEEAEIARQMHQAGAEALICKTASPADLLKAIYGDGKDARPPRVDSQSM